MSNKKKRKTAAGSQKSRPKGPNAQARHINSLHAQMDRLEAMTPVGQRRIFASFPELRDLFESCAWLVSVVDPTVGRTYGTIGRTSDHDNVGAMMAAGDRVAWFRGKQEFVRERLNNLNEDLADKIEATEHDRYKPESPRCWRRKCSEYALRQSLEQEACRGCGEPFGGRKE